MCSLADCIIKIYEDKDVLVRFTDDKTLIDALDGGKKAAATENIYAKLRQFLRARCAYGCSRAQVVTSDEGVTLYHILARDYDEELLKLVEPRYLRIVPFINTVT